MATRHTPEEARTEALVRFNDPGPGHINCAQAVVCFALLVQGRDPGLLTAARYFGGGVAGTGETCGAITGAALALGLRDMHLAEEAPELRPRTTERLQELIRGFTVEFGARRCNDLTGFDLSTPEGHDAFMESEARKRCQEYVGWMCDGLAPMLLDADTGADHKADPPA
jgi:C_GCAxxG_C_C family probable redox protein